MSRRRELARTRALLLARSERQRRELASRTGAIAGSLRRVDAAAGLLRRAAAHPLLLAGAVAAVVAAFRPGRLLRGLSWGLSAAMLVQRAAALLQKGARVTPAARATGTAPARPAGPA